MHSAPSGEVTVGQPYSRKRNHSLAVDYAYKVARFGVETSIVVPGAFKKGASHFPNAGKPRDAKTVADYDALYQGIFDAVGSRLSALMPDDADPKPWRMK